MSIPGLDLCPVEDCSGGIELCSFKGKFLIPNSQIKGACRHVSSFTNVVPLKITSTWIMRKCSDAEKNKYCSMKYKDSKGSEDDLENDLAVLQREISILNMIQHHNIIHFFGPVVGDTLENNHLLFDFAPYFLSDLISKYVTGLYQKPMIKNIIYQLLNAIDYLHDKSIIHGDVAPINILFNEEGILKLANFRHARKINSEILKIEVLHKNYQAPEIILKAKDPGRAVDMWAVGCVFAELLLKKTLFTGNSNESVYQSIINVLGAPNNLIWKDYDNLPGVQHLKIESSHSNNFLRKVLQKTNLSTPESIKLLKDILIYDPVARPTARECLQHPYFNESPSAYPDGMVAELLKLSNIIKKQNAISMQQ